MYGRYPPVVGGWDPFQKREITMNNKTVVPAVQTNQFGHDITTIVKLGFTAPVAVAAFAARGTSKLMQVGLNTMEATPDVARGHSYSNRPLRHGSR